MILKLTVAIVTQNRHYSHASRWIVDSEIRSGIGDKVGDGLSSGIGDRVGDGIGRGVDDGIDDETGGGVGG